VDNPVRSTPRSRSPMSPRQTNSTLTCIRRRTIRSPVHIRCQSRVYTSIVLQVFGLPNYHACLYFYINYDCLPFSSLYKSTAASARRALEFILEDTVQEIHDHFKTKLAASDIPASHNWEVDWRNIMLDDFVFRRDVFILMEFRVADALLPCNFVTVRITDESKAGGMGNVVCHGIESDDEFLF